MTSRRAAAVLVLSCSALTTIPAVADPLVGETSSLALLASGAASRVPDLTRLQGDVPGPGVRERASNLEASSGPSCEAEWIPTFGGRHGADDRVLAMSVFDDGSGAALFAGGRFTSAGGVDVSRIAKWDGAKWSALGSGVDGDVHALAVFDDGSGAALYVGGAFSDAGGVSARRVARWDGSSWSPLGAGTNGLVHALAVFDDGGGPALFAAGAFTSAGGLAASRIARWDGATWSPVGGGADDVVRALAVHHDGASSALYAGGYFLGVGGITANRVAKWDGAAWSPLGLGMNGGVHALASFIQGSNPELCAGGDFTNAGGGNVSHVARWNGVAWHGMGGGLSGTVEAFALHALGSGAPSTLFAGGSFSPTGGSYLSRWTGTAWSGVNLSLHDAVYSLASFDDGSGGGTELYAGGDFLSGSGKTLRRVTKWNGTTYFPVGSGLNGAATALTSSDSGHPTAAALYVGGDFTVADGVRVDRIARWSAGAWWPLGSGLSHIPRALTMFDDGGGPALFAAGEFTTAGGVSAARIARWDGASWSALGAGLNNHALAMVVFDDGSGAGPALYVGGEFSLAGGVSVDRIAKWDGAGWSPLGDPGLKTIQALAVFDHGTGAGPRLHAGGTFLTGSSPEGRVSAWNGSSWDDIGVALNNSVRSLAVFNAGFGAGPELHAGGIFTQAGTEVADKLARWDGSKWVGLGSLVDGHVLALCTYDDGEGLGLHASGFFTTAGGVHSPRVARWNGGLWSGLGAGLTGVAASGLHVHDDGSGGGPMLVVGGSFTESPSGDAFIARWGGCLPTVPGTVRCPGDRSGTACPCGNPGGLSEGCANSLGYGGRLSGAGTASAAADNLVFHGSGLLSGQAALLFAGTEAVASGAGVPFGDGLRCAGGTVVRLGVRIPDPRGEAEWGPGLVSFLGLGPGDLRIFQGWYRDPASSPCGTGFNLTNGYEVVFH